MDRANHALANHLSRRGDEVHLVAYRAAADLLARPNLTLHAVNKPFNSYHARRPAARPPRPRRGRPDRGEGGAGDRQRRELPLGRRQLGPSHQRARRPPARWLTAPPAQDAARLPRPRRRRAAVAGDGPADRHDLREESRRPRPPLRPARRPDRGRLLRCRPRGVPARRPRRARRPPGAVRLARRPADLPVVGGLGPTAARGSTRSSPPGRCSAANATWAADLVVVGDGAERPAWQNKASEAGLGGRIRFLGSAATSPTCSGLAMRTCCRHAMRGTRS